MQQEKGSIRIPVRNPLNWSSVKTSNVDLAARRYNNNTPFHQNCNTNQLFNIYKRTLLSFLVFVFVTMFEDESDYNFLAEVAKSGRAACKHCKTNCEKDQVRMAKLLPNPFG